MITQSTVLPRGTAIDLCPALPQPTVANGSWSGLGVVIQSGVIPFLQSLHPGFLPSPPQPHGQWAEGPAFTIGSGGQGHGFLLGTELAARLVSACAALPAEVGSLLGGFASLCAGVRLAKDQLGAGGAATGSPPEPDWVDNRVDGSPTNDKDKASQTQRKWRELTSPPITAPGQSGQLAKAAVALGAISGLTAAGAEVLSDKSDNQWIEVADAATLGKIGHDPSYPLNGKYQQVANIDGGQLPRPIGNLTHPFTGQYDGQCHTIENLRHCLMQIVEGEDSRVDNLCFTGANIHSTGTAGVAACEISDMGAVTNIRVENAYVTTTGEQAFAGIGSGSVLYNGILSNTSAVDCLVKTSGRYAEAGIGAGQVFQASVDNTFVVASGVDTSGFKANAGIGVGAVLSGMVSHTEAVNCTVESSGDETSVAIGAGYLNKGVVSNTTAIDSKVKASGKLSMAGIGAGIVSGTVSNTTAVNSQVAISGCRSFAGIGAGYLGEGAVSNTTAVDSQVETSGDETYVAIGAGYLYKGVVSNTTAIDSQVEISSHGSVAGIGVGIRNTGTVSNTAVVNSQVKIASYRSYGRINGGDNASICNTFINGIRVNDSANGCAQSPYDWYEPTVHQPLNWNCQRVIPTQPITSLVNTVSTSAITGIALGTAAFVLVGVVGGVCLYRHYHRGPLPADTDDQQL